MYIVYEYSEFVKSVFSTYCGEYIGIFAFHSNYYINFCVVNKKILFYLSNYIQLFNISNSIIYTIQYNKLNNIV